MKAKKIMFPLFLLCISLFAIIGCTPEQDIGEPLSIIDFDGYADLTLEGTDSIEVNYDNNTGTPFIFTIDDKTVIDEIMNLIFSAEWNYLGTECPDGGHTYLKIKQGKVEYSMSVQYVKLGNNYYSFKHNNLQTKITELATAAGAYSNIKFNLTVYGTNNRQCNFEF